MEDELDREKYLANEVQRAIKKLSAIEGSDDLGMIYDLIKSAEWILKEARESKIYT